MAMHTPQTQLPLDMPFSGCQLLPGLCISAHDEGFAQQGAAIYRVQPQGAQVLDVLIAHTDGWHGATPPSHELLPTDALQATASPQAHVQALHARLLALGMPASAQLSVLCLRIDLQHSRVHWVGCGTPAPIVFHAAGDAHVLQALQPALGAAATPILEDSFAWLAGDALFLGMASGGALDAQALQAAMAEQRQLHPTPAMALHGLRASGGVHAKGVLLLLLQQHARGLQIDRLELPVSLEVLTPLREFVERHAQRAGMPEAKEAGLVLATVEVVTNVIRHAKNLLPLAPIEILVEHQAHALVLSIRYFGQAYQPESVPQTHDLSSYPEGGFGQYIIEQVCDQVHYGHHAGVNLVQLTVSSGN